ncbi:MAG: hypothetical protein ABII88_01920 [Candidatus Omnitrophota bacterium]
MKKYVFVIIMLLVSSVCFAQEDGVVNSESQLIGKWDGYAASLDAQTPISEDDLDDEKLTKAIEFRYSKERLEVFLDYLVASVFECFIFEADGKLISRNSNQSKDEILNWKIEGDRLDLSGDKWLYMLKGENLFLALDCDLWKTMEPVYIVLRKDPSYAPPQKTDSEKKVESVHISREESFKIRDERRQGRSAR